MLNQESNNFLAGIPQHWKVVPAWSLYRRVKRTGHENEELLSVYRDHGVIPKSSRDDNHNVESEDLSGYQLVKAGDLVMNKMKAWQGSIALSEYQGIVSPAYFVFQPLHKGHLKYFHYLLRSHQYIGVYNRISKGVRVGQWDLDPAHFRTLPIPVPPLEEQKTIAEFLDSELHAIDQLIRKQHQLVETLAIRRQALITGAVTTGLSATVVLRPTDLPWLGNIPKNWELQPLKYLVELNKVALSETTTEDFRFNYIEISDVTKESGVGGWTEQTFANAPSRARRLVKQGDVLVSTVRTYLRAVGTVPAQVASIPFVASTGFAALSPKKIDTNFLKYALTAEHFVARVEAKSTGISYPAINASDLVSIKIPVPPIDEQKAIGEYLDGEMKKLDQLAKSVSQSIELLSERKRALISAAVTGKIDVRGKN
jgi:type I restriction enzyme S subunit